MPTGHEFNAGALIELARHSEAARNFRRGTSNRSVETQEAVVRSRVLLANLDAVLLVDTTRAGWLWPVY
jgi:hypothetical protein